LPLIFSSTLNQPKRGEVQKERKRNQQIVLACHQHSARIHPSATEEEKGRKGSKRREKTST